MKGLEKLDIGVDELMKISGRLKSGEVVRTDLEVLQALITTFLELVQALDNKKASIARLRAIIFGAKTEKTRDATSKGRDCCGGDAGRKKKGKRKKRKGHGRNGVDAYPDAKRIPVPHETMKAGQVCPCCVKGKLHDLPAGKELRIVGQPPLTATLWEPGRLRCSLCGEVFTAKLPEEAGTKKYDESAGAMIALLKYGTGMPFYRLGKLQEALHVPVPASVQFEIVDEMARQLEPIFDELEREAAQGQILHNDDTGAKVLSLGGEAAEGEEPIDEPSDDSKDPKRKGIYTTAIVAIVGGHQIALYFTGQKYAGENLEGVLRRRQEELPPPIQMCDALLSRNLPGELKTIVANCIAHARRKFFGAAPHFPEGCQHVLEELAKVYRIDELAKKRELSPESRLALHKENSGPVMDELEAWLRAQLDEKKVEANSSLGKAIKYFLNHWERMTLFLRVPGAPLDNNICERIIKLAILHRKNAYFYKTERGAAVGDRFMSLIQTARLNGVNPYEYLVALQKNAAAMRERPSEWLPWNYKATLARGPSPG